MRRLSSRELATLFHFHPLAMEDAVNVHQRPKVDRYGEQLFIALRMDAHSAGMRTEPDLASITQAYFQLLDAEQNTVGAVVTIATPLSAPQQQEIEQRLSAISGKTIRAEYRLDSSLIGGFRAIFGDTMMDASVRHQLDRMHDTLLQGSLN